MGPRRRGGPTIVLRRVLPHHGAAKPVATTARNSIGLVLVGGMTIGTIFTLLIVPSLYMLIAKEQKKSA